MHICRLKGASQLDTACEFSSRSTMRHPHPTSSQEFEIARHFIETPAERPRNRLAD